MGNPESCEQCELKESDSPRNHEKAGAQHAVREHGQSELKDREPPESLRALRCPESFCSGTLAKHAVEEHGHSELQEGDSSDDFGEPFAKLAPSDRASLGPGPLYVDRNLREAGSCDLGVFDAEADRVVEGLCRPCLVSDPVSQRSECCRCEPCGGGKVHVCLPTVAKGGVQPVVEALRDPVPLDPVELAELEADLSAVEMSIRETLAGVSGRRMQGTRALLQRAVDMRALLVTRR